MVPQQIGSRKDRRNRSKCTYKVIRRLLTELSADFSNRKLRTDRREIKDSRFKIQDETSDHFNYLRPKKKGTVSLSRTVKNGSQFEILSARN